MKTEIDFIFTDFVGRLCWITKELFSDYKRNKYKFVFWNIAVLLLVILSIFAAIVLMQSDINLIQKLIKNNIVVSSIILVVYIALVVLTSIQVIIMNTKRLKKLKETVDFMKIIKHLFEITEEMVITLVFNLPMDEINKKEEFIQENINDKNTELYYLSKSELIDICDSFYKSDGKTNVLFMSLIVTYLWSCNYTKNLIIEKVKNGIISEDTLRFIGIDKNVKKEMLK
jgi:hypothetical protein